MCNNHRVAALWNAPFKENSDVVLEASALLLSIIFRSRANHSSAIRPTTSRPLTYSFSVWKKKRKRIRAKIESATQWLSLAGCMLPQTKNDYTRKASQQGKRKWRRFQAASFFFLQKALITSRFSSLPALSWNYSNLNPTRKWCEIASNHSADRSNTPPWQIRRLLAAQSKERRPTFVTDGQFSSMQGRASINKPKNLRGIRFFFFC